MIVTAHQPNYLPGLSVVEKVGQADVVIWLEEVQFTRGGFTNRQRMPDGSWLTVPVERSTLGGPINGVKVAEHRDWRRAHQRTLVQHYGRTPLIDSVCDVIGQRPWSQTPPWTRTLVTLNYALLLLLLGTETRWAYDSALDLVGATVSERLANMVVECGGTQYLSGPSGRRYLDETPFRKLGVTVRYYDHAGPNPCVLDRYRHARAA